MKKRLFFIIFMTLFCSTMFGQDFTPKYAYQNNGAYPEPMSLLAKISFDGVVQNNPNLELGVFCDEELRGGCFLSDVFGTGENVAMISVYGKNGQKFTFKVYDHTPGVESEKEWTISSRFISGSGESEHMSYNADGYVDPINPAVINFVTPNHWTPNTFDSQFNFNVIAVVMKDGVEQTDTNLELGVFDADGKVRGSVKLISQTILGNTRYYADMLVPGSTGEEITFRLYDHGIGQEFSFNEVNSCVLTEEKDESGNPKIGSYIKPFEVNFITAPYVAQIGENKYLSFDAALEAAKDGDNIELLKSIDLGTTTAVISKSVNITLGSFSITGTVELAHTSATITGKAEGMTVVSGVENYLVNFDEKTNVYSLVERSVSGKVAYRAYINDVADREAVQVDLTNVYATTSFVVELLDADGNVLTTTSLNAGAVNAETYTCNIVLDGTASSSWTTEKKAQKLTVANIPQTIKVYADGTLVDEYDNALGAGTNVDETEKYKALDCVYKEASITRNGTTEYYATLEASIAAAQADETITMLADITLTETLTIAAEKNFTLDLNGKTIDGTENVKIAIMSYGDLTIKDSTAEKNGTIKAGIGTAGNTINVCAGTFTFESGNIYSKNNAILIDKEAAMVNIKGGTITAEPSTDNSAAFYISSTSETTVNIESGEIKGYNGVLLWNNTTLNITGGSITAEGRLAIQGNGSKDNTEINISGDVVITGQEAAIYHPQGGDLNISGGTISGETGIIVKGGNVNISAGTINGTGAYAKYEPISSGFKGTGDALYVEHYDNSTNSENYGTPVVTVTGGTFNSTNAKPIASYVNTNNNIEAIESFVSGGTFNKEISEDVIAHGYILEENQDGTYGVIPGTCVYSYVELVEAIQDNASTIFIGADIDIEELTTIPANVNVIVKDGFTLNVLNTLTNNGTIKGDGNVNVRVMVYVVETVEPYEGVSYDVRATKNGAIDGTAPENSVQYQISLDGGQTWFEDTTNGKAQAVTVKTDGTTVVSSSFQSAYTSAKTGETVHMLTDAHVQSTNPKKNNGPLRSYYGLILEGNGHTIFTDLEISGASNEYATIKFTSYLAGTGPEVNPILKNVTVDSQKNAKADLDYVSGDVTFTVTMYNVNLLGNCQYSNFAMKSPSMIVNKSNVEIYDSNIPSWDADSANAINIYSGEYSLTLNNKCTVYGGTYTKDVTAYLADGLILIQNEEGKYVVDGYYEAKIGTTGYETLEAAFAAATDGCTIDLLADVEISNTLSFNFNSAFDKINVTFNGNGKTIKAVGSDWDYNKWLADIAWNVTLNDVTFDGNNTGCKGVQFYTSTSTLNNVTVKNVSADKWNSTDYAIHANASELTVKGNLTFEGCKHGMLMVDLGSNTGKVASVVSVDANVSGVTVILNHKDASMNAPTSAASYVSVGNVPGYTMVYENGSFKLVEAVAQIEEILYATLAEAFVAATEGQTVTLLKDITLSETLTIEEAITLDLNNKTVTGADGAIVFNVKAAIKIENGTIDIQINLTAVGSTVEGPEGLNVVSGVGGYMVIYENNTYKLVKIEGQSIVFGERWNWFSHYVVGDTDSDILNQLKNGLGEHGVQIKNQNQFIDYGTNQEGDSGWWGDLKSTSVKEMYKVNTSLENPNTITVVFEGAIVNPESYPITLNANWNYIGYPLTESVSVKAAFASVAKDGDYVKSQDAFAEYYNGNWHGNLKTMTPGEGYMYRNVLVEGVNDVTKTLIYSYPRTSEIAEANITAENNHWVPASSQYADNMTMIAMLDVKGEDYEVAAFVNGEVRGSARATYIESLDAYMFFMTIHGEGVEEMTFKCYDLATGEDYLLDNRMNYSSDAVVGTVREPYMLTCSTLGIGENAASVISIYPNPATTGNEINLAATCDTVEVFNALGVKIAEYQNVDTIDAIETAGVYMIRVTNNGNVQNCRLVVK